MLEKMDNNDEDWMTPIKVERYAEMEEEWQRPYSVLKKNDEGETVVVQFEDEETYLSCKRQIHQIQTIHQSIQQPDDDTDVGSSYMEILLIYKGLKDTFGVSIFSKKLGDIIKEALSYKGYAARQQNCILQSYFGVTDEVYSEDTNRDAVPSNNNGNK
jgi:hypothetical protein